MLHTTSRTALATLLREHGLEGSISALEAHGISNLKRFEEFAECEAGWWCWDGVSALVQKQGLPFETGTLLKHRLPDLVAALKQKKEEQKRKEQEEEEQKEQKRKEKDELVKDILKMLPTDASDGLKKAIGDLVHNKVEKLNLWGNNI